MTKSDYPAVNDQPAYIPLKQRLAYKQARFVVICALALGLIFSGIQIYVDLLQQKRDLSQTSLQAINIMKRTAVEAAFNLDTDMAEEVATGLFEYAPFVFVKIVGLLGNEEYSDPLVVKQRMIEKARYGALAGLLFGSERRYRIALSKSGIPEPNIGILVVHVDPYPVAISFINRSLATLMTGVLRAVVLALIVFSFFYFQVTKPLNRLSDAWLKVQPDAPSPNALPEPGQHLQDEIGQMTTRAQDFLRIHRQNLDRRTTMEQQLILAKDELEERVRQRTESLQNEIKEKELIQQDLLHAKQIAEQATQAKSVFLATMSHEIRTPLHGVLGMLQVLCTDTLLSAKQQSTLAIINDSARLLSDIINDVLDLSKIEAGQLVLQQEPVSISQLVASSIALMRGRAEEKGLALTQQLPAGIPSFVVGDTTRLQQIILNLIANAIKFTQQGEVCVSVTIAGFERSRVVLHFDISDTGTGLSDAQQRQVFEPFVQATHSTSTSVQGTGLGLPICRKLLALMNGKIGVKSRSGKGSCFWFEIPFCVCETDQTATAEPPQRVDPSSIPALRILLAEDNPVNRKIAEELLSGDGHQVKSVTDGLQALHSLQSAEYDLILMDNHMPNLSGLDAIKAIRSLPAPYDKIPIIMVSADAITKSRELSLAYGADAFLSKPFQHDQLRVALAQILPSLPSQASPVPRGLSNHAPPVSKSMETEAHRYQWIKSQKLNKLRQSIGDKLALEVLADITQQISDTLARLPLLNAAHNATELRLASHSLLGTARELEFERISDLCQKIESASIEQQFDQCATLIQQLADGGEQIARELQDYRSQIIRLTASNNSEADTDEPAHS